MTEPEVASMIDKLLDTERPDRYPPEDKSWWDQAIAYAESEVDPSAAVRTIAVQMVTAREGLATRRTNALIRETIDTGEWPIDWMDAKRRPLAIGGHLRVTLEACTPADLREFATIERRNAAHDFNVRNATCEAAEELADRLETDGTPMLGQLSL